MNFCNLYSYIVGLLRQRFLKQFVHFAILHKEKRPRVKELEMQFDTVFESPTTYHKHFFYAEILHRLFTKRKVFLNKHTTIKFFLFTVLGQWADLSPFSACTKTCGSGTRFRTRICNEQNVPYGGKGCNEDAVYSEDCNTFTCP